MLLVKAPAALAGLVLLVAVPFAGTLIFPWFSKRLLIPCSVALAVFYGLVLWQNHDVVVLAAVMILIAFLNLSGLAHLKAHVFMLIDRKLYHPSSIVVNKPKAACFDALERVLANIQFENDYFDNIHWQLTTIGKDREYMFDDDRLEKVGAITASTKAKGWKWKEEKYRSILDYPRLDMTATACPIADGQTQINLAFDLRCEMGSTEVCDPLVTTTTEQIARFLLCDVVPSSPTRFVIVWRSIV
jgi:hypothetical protein